MSESGTDLVSYDVRDGVAWARISNGKANALSFDVLGGLDRCLTLAEEEASVGALVITGTPGFLTGGATGDIKLVDAWGVRGAFNHNWDPYWSSSLWGSYAGVRYGGNANDILTAKGQFCASFNFGKAVSGDYSCNPDYNIAQVGVVTRWTPVKNLTFSAEVGAFFLDQKFTGAATLTPAAPKPTAVYEFKDQSTVFLNVRVQRNF